jgi:ATPase subunit of ABC transporter with duplicated ATPase domains
VAAPPPDSGAVWRQPGLKLARLVQDVPLTATRSVFDVVAEGLNDLTGHDMEEWRRELLSQDELFMKLYSYLPKEMIFQRELLVARL